MNSNYQYSINVDEALERYGAKTTGTLERRVARLRRFTDIKNRKYADDIKLDHARLMANREREERVQRRIQEAYEEEKPTAPVFLRRNLNKAFLSVMDERENHLQRNRDTYRRVDGVSHTWMGSPTYLPEENQEVEIPMTSSPYNLRPRNGLHLLCRAIENGFVSTKRG